MKVRREMDWRENGKALAERHEQTGVKWLSHFLIDVDSVEARFFQVLFKDAGGDSLPLINYLRSEQPLTGAMREALAAHLEEKLVKTGRRGPDRMLRLAATHALQFYEHWRWDNRRLGINDRGHATEMKDE